MLAPCLTAGILLGRASTALACDSTGCLLQTRGQNGVLAKGSWMLDASFRYSDVSKRLKGRDEVETVLRPRVDYTRQRIFVDYHDERAGHESFVSLDLAHGLGARTTLLLSVPLLSSRSYDIAHAGRTQAYDVDGFGDAVFGARQALAVRARSALVAGLAVKTPTGRTNLIDPFDEKPLDPMLQPGSGAFSLLGSLEWSLQTAAPRIDWSLTTSYQANTATSRDYRFGNELIASLRAGRTLGQRFAVQAQLKSFHQGRHRFLEGTMPSTGTTVVYVNGGLRFNSGAFGTYAVLQMPVYRYVNETQLAPRRALLLGVSRSF